MLCDVTRLSDFMYLSHHLVIVMKELYILIKAPRHSSDLVSICNILAIIVNHFHYFTMRGITSLFWGQAYHVTTRDHIHFHLQCNNTNCHVTCASPVLIYENKSRDIDTRVSHDLKAPLPQFRFLVRRFRSQVHSVGTFIPFSFDHVIPSSSGVFINNI